MKKAKPKKRLSKLPESRSDYVVEVTIADNTFLHWFDQRADARQFYKGAMYDRIRIFRIRYELVIDRKRK